MCVKLIGGIQSEFKVRERVELSREAEVEEVSGWAGGFCTIGTHVHAVRHTHVSIVSILK